MSEKQKDPKHAAASAKTEETAEHGKKSHDGEEKHHDGEKKHNDGEKKHHDGEAKTHGGEENHHEHKAKHHDSGEKAPHQGEKGTSPAKLQHQSQAEKMREEKEGTVKWSEQRCHRAARRFTSVDEWQVGAPSSYKAAVAKGWVSSCSSHMKTTKGNVAVTSVANRKKTPPPAKVKKSA